MPRRKSSTTTTKIAPRMMPVPLKPLVASWSSSETTTAEPASAPHSVPMPPSTVTSTTLPDVCHATSCSEAKPWLIANRPPAVPASPAESTNATTL